MKKEALQKVKERFENKFEKVQDQCWQWKASTFPNGYGQFQFEGRPHGAHRVSYTLYKEEIPKGFLVCHTCDNVQCVNPDHLFLGTEADNMQDKTKKGRAYTPPGEKNGSSKLSNDDIREIRNSSLNNHDLAKKFGVVADHIQRIKTRKVWKHLKD